MKKLLLVVFCSMATVAMAAAPSGFAIVGAPDIVVDQSVVIEITAASAGDMAGLTLNLEATGPFAITAIQTLNVGGPWTSTNGDQWFTDAGSTIPNLGVAYTSATGANVPATAGAIVAKVTLVRTGEGDGTFSTASPFMGAASDWGDGLPTGQATVNLVPEPVTALLLLAGIPFLRRRHA
jgi:hypothetical protein